MPDIQTLIIDDEPNNIEVLGLLLISEGASYTGVTRKRDVFETIAKMERVDVIFLDLEMPNDPSYHDMLREFKQLPKLEGVPIVAYTVHVAEIDQARQAGFDHFLAKPLKVSEFPDQLRRILAGEPVWDY